MDNDKEDKKDLLRQVITSLVQGNKVALIMRGLSGSGKSTLARDIGDIAERMDYDYYLCSADNYFSDSSSEFGHTHYEFDRELLPRAHNYCLQDWIVNIRFKTDLMILDNTNCEEWEWPNHQLLAEGEGYDCIISPFLGLDSSLVGGQNFKLFEARNVHGVDELEIRKQWDRYKSTQHGNYWPWTKDKVNYAEGAAGVIMSKEDE